MNYVKITMRGSDSNEKIPIGISDFKNIIEDGYYYVDKSLFIKEIIDDGAKVILLPRPRRFGKTLNMSMLKYFYELNEGQNRGLFKGLNIENHKEIMDMQGKYPVIYITFKDIKDKAWEKCFKKIIELISDLYDECRYVLENNILSEIESIYYRKVLLKEASSAEYETSLKNLSRFLSKYQ